MGTSQMVTKSWNAQPDGRPGGPRKTRGGPEDPEDPGRPGRPGRPGEARKTRKAPEAPEGPGRPRKAPEGPRRAQGCKRPCPETGEALPGCLSGRRPASGGRRRDCRCTACGGQAPGLPVHGLRRAGVPSLSDPAASGLRTGGLRTGGGCGLAPVQGRLSASLKQVPGCLKGRCPATWVHERAEIAPNRAQRQRPAASGRSRGDCPQVQGQNTAAGRFFLERKCHALCLFDTDGLQTPLFRRRCGPGVGGCCAHRPGGSLKKE